MISDSHGYHDKLRIPSGIDIVMHGGDGSNARVPSMNAPEMDRFLKWYDSLYMEHKIMIGGNHDTALEVGMVDIPDGITLLYNQMAVIDGLKVYGSPYSPRYGRWGYMLNRYSEELENNWNLIPDNLDILITHSPPHGVLDSNYVENVGCELLAKRLENINVSVHMFGHIHEQAGQILKGRYDSTLYVNAAVVTFESGYINNGVILNYEYYPEE